ncbi:FHA domain-containing protein [Noviherbaspirillum saxi]|uniref:FHA domain-containing protein n=1 Tax=Noviherbaspirillum saxi TaxID=2320863 RepID=UPI001313E255|nr:FHA domain-containing protein [Noviherbaspirillum saxi]
MAKIILSSGNAVLRELPLVKARITIGRAPQNDLVIDDPAISAEHAAITTAHDGSYLEDLNSTNGTEINGQPVRTHFLQDKDVVTLARYTLIYLSSNLSHFPGSLDLDITVGSSNTRGAGIIKLRTELGADREIALSKPLTTIGLPGSCVALIANDAGSYAVARIEGSIQPLLNGRPLGDMPETLRHGDMIKVANSELHFLLL